jgi:hypothetical protein
VALVGASDAPLPTTMAAVVFGTVPVVIPLTRIIREV